MYSKHIIFITLHNFPFMEIPLVCKEVCQFIFLACQSGQSNQLVAKYGNFFTLIRSYKTRGYISHLSKNYFY